MQALGNFAVLTATSRTGCLPRAASGQDKNFQWVAAGLGGQILDSWDALGTVVAITGAAIILLGPRPPT